MLHMHLFEVEYKRGTLVLACLVEQLSYSNSELLANFLSTSGNLQPLSGAVHGDYVACQSHAGLGAECDRPHPQSVEGPTSHSMHHQRCYPARAI